MFALLLSFLSLCLHIAIIVLVAYVIVWLCKVFKVEIDPNVYWIGKIIVLILIVIAVVAWLSGLVGGYDVLPLRPWR